jgi:hypothetical protein
MGEKKQVKLWLPEAKVAELEQVALDWGYKSTPAVVEQLIDSYLEFFVAAEKAREAEIQRQKQKLFRVKQPQRRKAG